MSCHSDFSPKEYCFRPSYQVISFCKKSLAIGAPGHLCLEDALKQYGLCEVKRQDAYLRSETECCFLAVCGLKGRIQK